MAFTDEENNLSSDYRSLYTKPAAVPSVPAVSAEKEPPQAPALFPKELSEEDTQEELELLPAKEPSKPHKKKLRKPVHRYGFVLGSTVLFLALVGVVFLCFFAGKGIYRAVTDDSALREWDTFINPVVIQDPIPFEDSASASKDFLLTCSLWRAMLTHNYSEYDSLGRTKVPLSDVLDAGKALFGPECKLQTSAVAEDSFFVFVDTENVFYVTPYSLQGCFAPYTEKTRKEGDTLILTVGYVSTADPWRNDQSGTPDPVKRMEYVLKTDPETQEHYIFAIRNPS